MNTPLCRFFFRLISFFCICAAVCAPPRFPPPLHPVRAMDRQGLEQAKAEDYFVMARDLERRGRHLEAERFYEMAYDLDPSSRTLRDQLVRKYMESGKFMQALLLVKNDRPAKDLNAEDKRMLAGIYIKTGEFKRAIEMIESIAEPEQDDYYSLAIMNESIGNLPKAAENYLAFFAINSASQELGIKIARLLVTLGRFASADSLVGKLLKEKGEQAALLDAQGIIALARHDSVSALEYFNNALAIDSTYSESARNAAQIYVQKNDYPNAIRYYELLCNRGPLYEQVYGRTLAVLYYYNRQYTQSESLLKKLLENAFDDADLHYYLGLIFIANRQGTEARLQLEKAIALNPDGEDAWRELCYYAIREKKDDEALSYAVRFVRQSPKMSASWRLQAYVLNLKKEHAKAIEALKKALALDSTDGGTWFELGSSYERNKQTDKAALIFKKVLLLKPDDAATLNYLGYMWAEKGVKLDSAEQLIKAALKKDPDNGAYLDSYAWIFFQKGDFQKAYHYISKAMVRIDDDPIVFEHCGDIFTKLNDWTRAASAYRKGLEFKPENEESVRKKIIAIQPFLESPALGKGP
jgi:tetratricopeptide (TPR) repeat protein